MKTILGLLLMTISAFADLNAWNNASNAVIRVGQIITGNGNSSFARIYNVRSFGAVGNGTTDDTATIQAAIDACDNADGGIVFFPNGTYKITGTNGLVVANANGSHGGQHYVSLRGESAVSTVLSYSGPTNGFAVVLLKEKYVTVEDMSIHRNGAVGTTAGLLLTGANSGTQSNGGYARNVIFDGWHVCIDAGPDSGFLGTSSEWVFDSVTFNTSDMGFANFSFNGLDFMFRMLQCANVTTNVWGATAGITVDGGSFSNCGTGFYCRNGGLFSIRNVRSEMGTGPFVDSTSTVVVENCLVNMSNTNNPSIALSEGNATIKMCQLGSYIGATNVQSLNIEDTGLNAQSVATTSTIGPHAYLRNYQTAGQTSGEIAMFSDVLQLNGVTASRAVAFDSSTNLTSATTTLTELNLLSGVASPIHSGSVGNGVTNSAGTISLAIAAGSNISLSTNSGQITFSATSSGAPPTGTMVNQGTPASTAIPKYSDTTGTNIAPSGILVDASNDLVMPSAASTGWSDALIWRDAANRVSLRNGTTAQGFRSYNTYTGSGTNEFADMGWDVTSNTFVIRTEKAGTGTIRNLTIETGGTSGSVGTLTLLGTGAGVRLGLSSGILAVGATSAVNGWNIASATPFGLFPLPDATAPIGSKTQRCLDVWNAGALSSGIFTTATNYTAGAHDSTILANGTTLTITLPTAVGVTGQIYTVKEIANSTGTVATTSSQNIDGATTYNLSAQYKFVKVQSDGTQWWIVGSN